MRAPPSAAAKAKGKLISWGLEADGSFTRLGDSDDQAGDVDLVAVSAIDGLSRIVVTARRETPEPSPSRRPGRSPTYVASMRNGRDDLQLIAFEVGRNGGLTRTGDRVRVGTKVTETAIVGLSDGRALTT